MFIEVHLICNIVLVLWVQYIDSCIYIFRFFSIIDYYKILSTVPCVTLKVLVCYLLYI